MDAWTNSLLLLRRYRYLLAYFLQHVEAYVNIIHIYRKTIYYNTALCSLIYSKKKKKEKEELLQEASGHGGAKCIPSAMRMC